MKASATVDVPSAAAALICPSRPSHESILPKFLISRRTFVIGAAASTLSAPRIVHAQEVAVPITVQAALLAKVAGYDKNLQQRANDKVKVLLVRKAGDGDSGRAALQMRSAL